MAVAVVPAAGRSRRMGRPKLLLPYRGRPLLRALLDSLAGAGVEKMVVVVAPGEAALRDLAEEAGAAVAVNPDPSRGMLSSVWAGLEALGGGERLAARGRALLVVPADHPAVASGTIGRLAKAVEGGEAALALPVFEGRRGHPLAIAGRLVPEIAGLDPAIGLRQLLEARAAELLELPVEDPGVVLDVDTPEDYRRLIGQD